MNLNEVRSSIARRLGINTAGLVSASRYVEGIVEMLLDATQHYDKPLSDDRLFGWHNVLFPSGRSGLYTIEVAKYRSEHSAKRFYSMSNEMKILQKEYYDILEKTQKGDGDITTWLLWFLDCFDRALSSTGTRLASVRLIPH